MISREKIIQAIENVPDEHLDELFKIIKHFEEQKEDGAAGESVMAKLRRIKISASPDFSLKANLYDLEGENTK